MNFLKHLQVLSFLTRTSTDAQPTDQYQNKSKDKQSSQKIKLIPIPIIKWVIDNTHIFRHIFHIKVCIGWKVSPIQYIFLFHIPYFRHTDLLFIHQANRKIGRSTRRNLISSHITTHNFGILPKSLTDTTERGNIQGFSYRERHLIKFIQQENLFLLPTLWFLHVDKQRGPFGITERTKAYGYLIFTNMTTRSCRHQIIVLDHFL